MKSQVILNYVKTQLLANATITGLVGSRIAVDLFQEEDECDVPSILLSDGGSTPTGKGPLGFVHYQMMVIIGMEIRGDVLATDKATLCEAINAMLYADQQLGGHALQLLAPKISGGAREDEPSIYIVRLSYPIIYQVPEGQI